MAEIKTKLLDWLKAQPQPVRRTIPDIGFEIGASHASVTKYLGDLEKEGAIRREYIISRGGKRLVIFVTGIAPTVPAGRNYVKTATRRPPAPKPWVNPFKGMTYSQRLDAIVERDRMSRLAPQ